MYCNIRPDITIYSFIFSYPPNQMDNTILKIAQEIRDRVRSANPGKTVWTDNICEMIEFKQELLEELLAMKIADDLISEMFFQYANNVLAQIGAESEYFSFKMFVPAPIQEVGSTKILAISKSIRGNISAANPGEKILTFDIQWILEPKQELISELFSMNLPEQLVTNILICYVNLNILSIARIV